MKPIHNQGKQAIKRLRRRLGMEVNRKPLPENQWYRLKNGYLYSGRHINENPRVLRMTGE